MSARLGADDDGVRRLSGSLDFDSVPALYGRTDELLAGEAVTLDLSGVEAAGSPAVALLLEWRRQARRRGVELRLMGIPESVRRMARLAGVEALLEDGGSV
jgi:phospholipid transport system transporter-binding protein